jgi:peptide/nickel transport system permease protein
LYGPLVSRIAAILWTLFVISLLVFVLMHAIPGGPFNEDKMPLPPASKANILRSYGLDRPFWQQYLFYLWNVVHLDFGVSYQRPEEPVLKVLAHAWPVTMHLGGMALGIALLGGLGLGVWAALRRNPPGDYLDTGVAVLFASACAYGVSHCACEPIRARATMRVSHYARGQNAPFLNRQRTSPMVQ